MVIYPYVKLFHRAFTNLQKLKDRSRFEYLFIEDICPILNLATKYEYIQKLRETGLSVKAALLTYSHSNNVGSLHLVWKVLESVDDDISESQQTIEKAKEEIPICHTRAMKTALVSKFGRVSASMKSVILCALYRELKNDASAPKNLQETEIDERMRIILEIEDTDIVVDLRHLNSGRKTRYDVF